MGVTKDQAIRLSELACDMRPHGAPRWDVPGVLAQIEKVAYLALADVTMAVARAASDRTLNTPGAISNLRSTCWRERVAERTAPRNLRVNESCWNGDHRYSAQPPCCAQPVPWAARPQKGSAEAARDVLRRTKGANA